ncbi:transforming acidic coiled-coil-containing protein 3 [Salmo trutta]|uniref:Transforming, acidic coiled-coil containing protein 3 n=1 Tax=Salmo trutta TaxID=8032 RepID=A0A674EMK0_SALTR|nr:transforming acidic coiled-coil-containing protein 3-like [Salmo trutta]XP_029585947.1 transforming acidic coiled-coil-containing protein 3-like [Salmo trutta]XP_029585948.1 transforming acidic coiled-coil-containing protein 3-like [Salmo trutta]
MSSTAVNDENRGICPGRKHSNSETSCDIFSLDQPTGRPSILRQSQAENLSNKTIVKGVKVCFQTPRRDPHTKRIESPTKSLKMASIDHCTKALESLQLTTPEEVLLQKINVPKSDVSSYPDDDMPIQSKGGYQLDFDNLDVINPFQGSGKMVLSPARPSELVESSKAIDLSEPNVIEAVSHEMLKDFDKIETALDETLPFMPSLENSLADISADVRSTDSSVITMTKDPAIELSKADEDETVQSSVNLNPDQAVAISSRNEETPLLPKGSYKFDFDDLDSVNPFQTGASKIQNSPVLGRKLPCNDPPEVEVEETAPVGKEMGPAAMVQVSQPVVLAPVQPEMRAIAPLSPAPKETSQPAEDSMPQPGEAAPNAGPVKLEFNFDDGGEIKRKPLPKRFVKRPPGLKPTEKKAVPEEKKEPLSKESPVMPAVGTDSDIPVPKGAYNFDKFDDPDFNPFGTNARMSDSIVCKVKSSLEAKGSNSVSVAASPDKVTEHVQKETAPWPLLPSAGDKISRTEPDLSATREGIDNIPQDQQLQVESCEVQDPLSGQEQKPPTEPDQPSLSTLETFELCQFEQNPQNGMSEFNEEFVPGTTFMANDFDGQMDYLEQFGSSNFKESALRKQSLYLKFDPLMRESPKKSGGPTGLNLPQPDASASRVDTQKTGAEEVNGLKSLNPKLLDVPPVQVVGPLTPLVQNSPMNLASTFPQPANMEDNIIEVLKYSQQDMDAAIAKIQKEVKEQEDQWKAKHDKLSRDNHEMGKIMSEFEATIAQILADKQREKEMAQAEITKVLQEKEQVSQDLNTMERSFSELFKRLDKYKEAIEGYKKNEEMLKKCAQDYLARIKKEEQRYQTLKVHAEHKIGLANEEIAEVRSKLKSEVSALQAQLRREQLKAQSLENSLGQKVKETEELTNLCDELIAKVQKG